MQTELLARDVGVAGVPAGPGRGPDTPAGVHLLRLHQPEGPGGVQDRVEGDHPALVVQGAAFCYVKEDDCEGGIKCSVKYPGEHSRSQLRLAIS